MAKFKVAQVFSYSKIAEVEADSLEEAQSLIEENPEDFDWSRTDEDDDYLDAEHWEMYNEEEDEWDDV